VNDESSCWNENYGFKALNNLKQLSIFARDWWSREEGSSWPCSRYSDSPLRLLTRRT